MSCWNLLGIEPTSNKVEIKKAFAQKVKENPPDKDPKLYQDIREAYNEAVKLSSHIGAPEESESANKVEAFETDSSTVVVPAAPESSVKNESEIQKEETESAEPQSETKESQSASEESDDDFFEKLAEKIKDLKDEKTAARISELRDKMSGNKAVKLKDIIDYVPYREPKKTNEKSQPEEEISVKPASRMTYRKVRLIVSIILVLLALILKVAH